MSMRIKHISSILTQPQNLKNSLWPPTPGWATCKWLSTFQSSVDETLSAIETPETAVTANTAELEQVLPVSYELGILRRKALKNRGVTIRYAVPSEEGVVEGARRPAHSWTEMTYPFASSPLLQKQYQRFDLPLLRLGMLLEDIDGFAGDISHLHVNNPNITIVTASVDKITWLQSPPEGSVSLTRDLRFTGQVSWTGRSSMEVLIEAHTRALEDEAWTFAGLARFVMVARDNKTGAGYLVPALQPETAIQKSLYTMGHYNREVRKRKRERSLSKAPPTANEIGMLQSLTSGPDSRAVPMSSTKKSCVRLMHSQDRNTNGKIYGGYLLREAYELAYATALLHTNDIVDPAAIQDVAFLQPVEISSIIEFTAQVSYVYGFRLLVNVQAIVHGKERVVTNDFTIAFSSRKATIVPVVPVTIQDAWIYIQGHRQHQTEQEEKINSSKLNAVKGLMEREL